MFDISKTTFKMALRRGLDLTVETKASSEATLLCIWEADNDCEWLCSYRFGDVLSWNGNIYLPQQIKEELPATIKNEAELRQVISFIAASLHFLTTHRGEHESRAATQ
jgi:hypothetical protein